MNSNQKLLTAAKNGNVKEVKKLLNRMFKKPEKIAEINYVDKDGYSALHLASIHN